MVEVTMPLFPWKRSEIKGNMVRNDDWCKSEVERISKIPGHSPRITRYKNRAGQYTKEILIVDDEYISLPGTDRARIRQFHKQR